MPDLETRTREAYSAEDLAFHAKVRERLEQMLRQAQSKYDSVTLDKLQGLQAEVAILKAVLGLPGQLALEDRKNRKESDV